MKYAFVQAHREEFGVRAMCRMPRIGSAARNALKVDLPLSLIGLIGRLVDIENRTVAGKLEERIDTLERQKLMLAEKAAKDVPSKGRLEDCMELTLKFLSRLCNIENNGTHAVSRQCFGWPSQSLRDTAGIRGMEL